MRQQQWHLWMATIVVAFVGCGWAAQLYARPLARSDAASLSTAQLQLAPDTRAWPDKVARQVLDQAAQSHAPLRVVITFRVPEAIRQLEAVAPGAPARLRWIVETGDGLAHDFAGLGLKVEERFSHLATVVASVPPDAIPSLGGDDRVDAVAPIRTVHALDTAGRDYMRVPAIQPPYNGAGVGIAILDTGVDYTNPELAPLGTKTIALFDAYPATSANYAKDDGGHGTEVAGIAAATGVNPAAAGVAPAATVVSVKVLNSSGNGDDTTILPGIDAVLASITAGNPYNIRAANMSFGGYDEGSGVAGVPPQPCDADDPAISNAFQELTNAGVVPVVASGNGGCTIGVSWPACVSTSLAVGAVYDVSGLGYSFAGPLQCGSGTAGCTDALLEPGKVACFCDSGPKLDVWAPTCSVAPQMGGGYDTTFCGTSASAPYAAGLAALLAQAQPGASAAALKTALRNAGTPITDPRNGLVRNLVEADQALTWLICAAPAAPTNSLANNTAICLGDSLVLSWSAVTGASSYTVQVASDPSFASPSSTSTTSLSFVFSSSQATAGTFYFRVEANTACGSSSPWSSTVAVSYTPQCPVTYSHTYFVSGIARLPGIAPAYWYTDLAALNPGPTTANVRLTFYGTAFPPVVTTTLAGLAQITWPDVLASLFGDAGPDKGVILVDSDQPIEVLSRTYSKITDPSTGAVETFGQQYQGLEASAGLVNGSVGYLANLRSDGVFRTNVEFVNVGAVTTDVEFRFFTDAGTLIATLTGTVTPQRWGQLVRALPAGQGAAFAEVRALAAGARILASASVIDGNSTDPTTIPLFIP